MKKHVSVFCLLFFINCGSSQIKNKSLNYSDFKSRVEKQKQSLKSKNIEEVKSYLFELINDSIPIYWKDTPWDFNGITQEPGKGNIACGYFITNTLTDIGFKIKRVYLAQQASSVMIKELTTNINYFSKISSMKDFILKQGTKEVFVVGLDFHTGYITKDGKDVYFIHSNYINKKGVVKELIDNSKALSESKTFMLGCLTQNNEVIKKWVE